MTSSDARTEIDRILEQAGDADDVLRAVVAALVTHGGAAWAGILFQDDGELLRGPEHGTPRPSARTQTPVVFNGTTVAELVLDACPDAGLAPDVADLISEYCLVGWDTGGIPWESLS